MHYPQLPDETGWDVLAMSLRLADDFRCEEDGPISQIHFWLSSRWETPFEIQGVDVWIHDNDLSGPYSKPGQVLWNHNFLQTEVTVRSYGQGDQGWYDPAEPRHVLNDHRMIYQANITDIPDPFPQASGEIYWLALTLYGVHEFEPLEAMELGWKTSVSDPFEDAAVWSVNIGGPNWQPLADPITGESLGLAFVIVPEPATLSLLVMAGAAAAIRRRRRA